MWLSGILSPDLKKSDMVSTDLECSYIKRDRDITTKDIHELIEPYGGVAGTVIVVRAGLKAVTSQRITLILSITDTTARVPVLWSQIQ